MGFWSSSHRLRFIFRQTAESRIRAIFLFAALLLVLVIGSVMVSSNSAQKAAKDVARTQRILALLEGFMVDLKDAEGTMRAFALTAKEPVADRYHQAVRRARLRLEDLRNATLDNPTQRILGEHLQQRLEQRIAHMDGAIELAKTQGLAAAQAFLIEGQGLVLMQELEEIVRQMREEETRLLSIRTTQWRQSTRSALWIFFSAGTVLAASLVFGYTMVRIDLRFRKQLAESAEQARRAAEQASEIKSRFLANMSHEIRTPMNGIIGVTSLLDFTPLTPEQRDYLRTIRRSGDVLLTLINDILDFSKIEAGSLDLNEQPFDLRESVEETMELFTHQAAEKKVELLTVIDPALPSGVRGDDLRLRQVLTNLIGNAVKFTQHGEVRVTINHQPSAPGCPDFFTFEVADSGIGMNTAQIERLFQPFTQGDASTTRRYGGTGLGLAISQRLVKAMGGTISVRSQPGQGSTFTFQIPLPLQPEATRAHDPAQLETLRSKRILIVEDHPTNRMILERLTLAWNMNPTLAASAQEAIEFSSQVPGLDLILADFYLPDHNGIELAQNLAAAGCTVPVVFLFSGGLTLDELVRAGVHPAGMLPKPVRQRALLRMLAGTFRRTPQPTQESYAEGSLADLLPRRIVLAEDEPVNRMVATRMLKVLGYRATIAENGQKAVDLAVSLRPDVILMDVQMPELDGLASTRAIREAFAPSHGPYIIAMTANALTEDREKCLAAGMDDYVSKPVKLEDLRTVLARSRPFNITPEI